MISTFVFFNLSLLLLLLKIRTAIDDIEAGFVTGSRQQQVA